LRSDRSDGSDPSDRSDNPITPSNPITQAARNEAPMPPEPTASPCSARPMSDRVFARLSGFIESQTGIKMPAAKKTMLQSRLAKRLRTLGMGSYESYVDHVFTQAGSNEVVTTNKTDFYREPRHFEILTEKVLPELIRRHGAGTRRPLKCWSAGSSTGAEAYTLAMVLSEYAGKAERFGFAILGTDICTEVLAKGRAGIYGEHEIQPVPMAQRRKYLLRSKDPAKAVVRIVPELRKAVHFERLNFMDTDYGIADTMDVVFCRNVIIYFDRATQQQVLSRICRHIVAGGYLFMGHSETLNGLSLPLVQTDPTVYRKTG